VTVFIANQCAFIVSHLNNMQRVRRATLSVEHCDGIAYNLWNIKKKKLHY